MSDQPPTPLVPGDVLDEVSFAVEAGKIREFARATHAEDPIHTDPDAATEAGFGAPVATATHVVVAGHHRDQKAFVAALGMDITRIVVGSVNWEYHRPIVAGDHLTGTRRILSDITKEGRRGGTMRLVELETTWSSGDVSVVTQRETLIERGA